MSRGNCHLQATSNLDVGEAVVEPSFRSTPWQAESLEESERSEIRIVFVSESNICRSPLAAGLMQQLLDDGGLASQVSIASRVRCSYLPTLSSLHALSAHHLKYIISYNLI